MLIYRLENEKGEGVYTRGYGFKCARQMLEGNDPTAKDLHPSPDGDPKLQKFWAGFHLTVKEMREWPYKGRRNWQCAFESYEQLAAWFPYEGIALMMQLASQREDDMALVVYKVPHHKVRKGETQVIYNKEHAEFVKRISLRDLSIMITG